ncbi:TPA: c-type cytochrome, partial [Burkholderia multivorans]|nr:c-type cytochrome [Burkholderia multivorans]
MRKSTLTFLIAGCLALPGFARAADAADPALVKRGEYLATAGDCMACHTVKGGKPYAGGLGMPVPMLGKIYTSNITPDPDTGIGKWTFEDFERAVRHGVSKNGDNLYPAMPYVSYAKITDDDVRALYAYFMHGVEPVKQAPPKNEIPALLSMRWPLKI